MEILNVMDKAFAPYGKVVTGLNVSDLLAALEKTPKPDDVIYVASDEALEACPSVEKIAYSLFGGMPIQVGYCNGSNYLLNAVEYHRDSEVNVALTDLILILGKEQDIEADGTYQTEKMEAFLVPAGTVVEVYATTLHYAPCGVDGNGFKAIYGQLMNVTVAEGDTITTAQNIGEVAPPSSYYTEEGTHVFFELMKNGVPINPMILMQ